MRCSALRRAARNARRSFGAHALVRDSRLRRGATCACLSQHESPHQHTALQSSLRTLCTSSVARYGDTLASAVPTILLQTHHYKASSHQIATNIVATTARKRRDVHLLQRVAKTFACARSKSFCRSRRVDARRRSEGRASARCCRSTLRLRSTLFEASAHGLVKGIRVAARRMSGLPLMVVATPPLGRASARLFLERRLTSSDNAVTAAKARRRTTLPSYRRYCCCLCR